MQELNEVLALTSQLAQLQTQITLAHDNFPWYTILEEMQDEQEQCQSGLGSLMGKGSSNLRFNQDENENGLWTNRGDNVCQWGGSIHELILAQCGVEAEGNCKEADDLQAMIDEQRAKISALKTKRTETSARKLP